MDPLVAAIDQGTSSTRFLVSFSEVSLFSCCVQGPGAAGTADYGDCPVLRGFGQTAVIVDEVQITT